MTKHIYRNCEWCSCNYKVRTDCKNQKFCSAECRILGYKKAPVYQTKNKLAYYANPTICKGCGCCLLYDFRKNKFCTNSCSTTFNNKHRKSPKVTSKNLACTACGTHKIVDSRCPSYICTQCKQIHRKRALYSKFSYCVICNCTIHHKYTKTCSKEYNGVLFDSSYEVSVAKSLDRHNISWTRPAPLSYTDAANKKRNYYPDFYLPAYNVFLDPKNDYLIETQCGKIRAAAKENQVTILILTRNQLEWDIIEKLIHNNYCGG